MERKIKWEKWQDPFVNEETEKEIAEEAEEEQEEEQKGSKLFKDSYERFEDNMNKAIKDSKKKPPVQYNGPLLIGPMGIVPLNEHNCPSKVYNFWMGHTNFRISYPIAGIIENTEGVEALDVFSPYRFRIAIGKCFLSELDPEGREVKLTIEKALCPKQEKVAEPQIEPSTQSVTNRRISMLKHILSKKYKHWAIFMLPDGKLDPEGASTKEELLKIDMPIVASSWE